MASQQLARGWLHPEGRLHQRPAIHLTIAPVHRGAWQLFRRHHYLNHELSTAAKCFVAFLNDEPVAFSSWVHRMTRNRRAHDMREHRTVVLPDFQGIGVGNRLSELCASIFTGAGGRAFSTTSHPGMIHYRNASPKWRTKRFGMAAPMGTTGHFAKSWAKSHGRQPTASEINASARVSAGRITGGFEYIGPKMDRDNALAMLAAKPRIFGDRIVERILAVIPAGGPLRTQRSIMGRTRLSLDDVSRALQRMEKSGDVLAQRVGKRYGFVAA
jgi:GNAT superfamily N-acetyltransferase